jgi:acetyl esterase/lipase
VERVLPPDEPERHRAARPRLAGRERESESGAHTYIRTLRRAFRRRPTFFAFYVGRGDTRFRAENLRLHRELVAAGVPHLFRLYPGAHAQTVWSTHATAWLQLGLDHLAA